MKLMVKDDPVVVEWLDAFTTSGGWQEVVGGEYVVRTAGFFVSKDRGYLRVVQSIGESGEFEGGYISPFSIPVGCIRRVEVLGKKKKDKKKGCK